jgi:hypothetical protein
MPAITPSTTTLIRTETRGGFPYTVPKPLGYRAKSPRANVTATFARHRPNLALLRVAAKNGISEADSTSVYIGVENRKRAMSRLHIVSGKLNSGSLTTLSALRDELNGAIADLHSDEAQMLRELTPNQWRDINEQTKAHCCVKAMLATLVSRPSASDLVLIPVTVNLSPTLIGRAIKSHNAGSERFLAYIHDQISQHMNRRLKRKVQWWCAVDIAAGRFFTGGRRSALARPGRPHLHGHVLATSREKALLREAFHAANIAYASGAFKNRAITIKHSGHPNPCGWAEYATRQHAVVRLHIPTGPLFYCTRETVALAKRYYETARLEIMVSRDRWRSLNP